MIPVRNIYYMLSYAFRMLETGNFESIAAEQFENVPDLFAQILIQGVDLLLKRGISCGYQDIEEPVSQLRGKIDVSASLRQRTLARHQMVCRYEKFTPDRMMNRIIKFTMELLCGADIAVSRKQKLRRQLDYFHQIRKISPREIDWHIRFDSQTETNRMLIGICYLTVKGLLMTEQDGQMKLRQFLDGQAMHHLYERFILEFYRRECPNLKADARQIPWAVQGNQAFLPVMQSDIFLESPESILIVDAKYYSSTMQTRFGIRTIHSANLYQIFTYVINMKEAAGRKPVSGVLLYARTDEDVQPDETYCLSGNTIAVQTLDLNVPFENIKAQLLKLAGTYLSVQE